MDNQLKLETNVVLGNVPNSISKVHLKLLLNEICHIQIPLKSMDEVPDGPKTKIVIIDFEKNVIPIIAMRRLQRFGQEVLPNVSVQFPESVNRSSFQGIPDSVRQKYAMPPYNSHYSNIAKSVTYWLHYELFLKYPQLIDINIKCNNELSKALAFVIVNRVMAVMNIHTRTNKSMRGTTAQYRKTYPCFADFELVSSNIKKVAKQLGLPLTQFTEEDLLVPTPPAEDEDKAKELHEVNFKPIDEKLKSYIESLDSEIKPGDSPKTVNQKRVRQSMKDISRFLPQMAAPLPYKDLSETPDWICLYVIGEPDLPRRMTNIIELLIKHDITLYSLKKNKYSYNAVKVHIARADYDKCMKLDGNHPEFDFTDLEETTTKLYIRHTNHRHPKDKSLPKVYGIITKWALDKAMEKSAQYPTGQKFTPVPNRFTDPGNLFAGPNRFAGPVDPFSGLVQRPAGPMGYHRQYSRRI